MRHLSARGPENGTARRKPPSTRRASIATACLAAALELACTTGDPVDSARGAPAPGAETGWLARAQRQIGEREYHASRNPRGLQAPNRAHGLRTYFTPAGIEVHDRTLSTSLVELRLVGVGRGSQLAAVTSGQLSNDGTRVTIERPGLVEWYENSPAGLEQGFTLARRPPGDEALALELALTGASASLRAGNLVFATAAGRRLAYGGLAASDANGRPLPARFELVSNGRVRLVVEDIDATYPVIIDPLLTATADTQIGPDQPDAQLGYGVASAGDVNGDGFGDVIVSAPRYDAGSQDAGAAFVFLGSAAGLDGALSSAAVLEGDASSVALGASVAGAGDVNGDGYDDVIVGVPGYGAPLQSAALVFLGSAEGIANGGPATAATRLIGNGGLGGAVSGAGDVNGDGYADVIVGAPIFTAVSPPGYNHGVAFVFHGSASGIADGGPATAATRIDSGVSGANFGWSVAAGDVNGDGYGDVIVGAPRYDAPSFDDGAAFVFHGGASGIASGDSSSAAAELSGLGAGTSVASAGDVNGDGFADVIIGARGHFSFDYGGTTGAALIFHGSATGVGDGDASTASTVLMAASGSSSGFGDRVAGAGDVNGDGYADVIVSSPHYSGGESNEGAAFVFHGSASGVPNSSSDGAATRLESNHDSAGTFMSLAGAGDVNGDGFADVIVGASNYGPSPYRADGAAFVYLGGAAGIRDGNPTTAAAVLETDQMLAYLGASVAGAGDVNGDGYADVIVGAPSFDDGEVEEGAAFVFLSGPAGIESGDVTLAAAAQLESNQSLAALGTSVASAGDVNGDGYADVIVGAPGYDAGQQDEGAAFVFLGSSTGIADGTPATAATRLESDQLGAGLGVSVASAGDVNGDAYTDVIVGARGYDAGQVDEGAAFIFLGGPAGVANGNAQTAAARIESDLAQAALGWSVAGAGDVNGDGYADVIVGAPVKDYWEDEGWSKGAAYVFHGSASGIVGSQPASAATRLESNEWGAFGLSVASAGDVNGDGLADVIVGAPSYDAGEPGEGVVFVYLGSPTGIADGGPASAAARLESNQASGSLGASVSGAGDVNGDGYADVIVGAPGFTAGQAYEGAAFVFLGSASGIADGNPTTAAARLESNQEPGVQQSWFGTSVAAAGDVNADGYADVVVGASAYPGFDNSNYTYAGGAAFVFLGNGGGRPVLARQQQPDGRPVEPWGVSQRGDGFRVSLHANHPAGAGRVRAEIEACPSGIPFGAAECVTTLSPAWVDVGADAADVLLVRTLHGLDEGALYRWRARILYAAASSTQNGITPAPFPAHGPWRRVQAQRVEADIRVIPEPDFVISLASGIALLAALARRRAVREGIEARRG